MLNRIKAALVALVLAVGGGAFIGASPALAAGCASNSICFYDGSTGTTLLEQVSASIRPRSVCYTLATAARDKTSYIANASGYQWVVFDNATCSSTQGLIYANSQGAMSGGFNNTITSYYRLT